MFLDQYAETGNNRLPLNIEQVNLQWRGVVGVSQRCMANSNRIDQQHRLGQQIAIVLTRTAGHCSSGQRSKKVVHDWQDAAS